jgi:hypothetical protein
MSSQQQPQPVYVIQQPPPETRGAASTALVLELIFGFFGILGIGHIYTGRILLGIALMIGWWVYIAVAVTASILTGGLLACLFGPIGLAGPIVSAIRARTYMLRRGGPGSWGMVIAVAAVAVMVMVVIIVVVLGAFGVGLSACALSAPPQTTEAHPTWGAAPTATLSPTPSSTSSPVPTVDTPSCTLGAAFEADVTVPDNTRIEVGQRFVKTWRIRNTGSCDWGPGYEWTFVDGEQMGGPDSVAVPDTSAGGSAEVSVELVAPGGEGQYRGYWQMCVNETECFGDRLYVQILSVSPQATESGTTVTEWEGVYIGMPADTVLRIHPQSETTEDPVLLGQDSEGLIVRWSYPGAYLIFALRDGEGTDSLGMSMCYRVIEIQLR